MKTDFGSHSLIFKGFFDDSLAKRQKREAVSAVQFLSELVLALDSYDTQGTDDYSAKTINTNTGNVPDEVLIELSRQEHCIDNINSQLYAFFAQGRERDCAPSGYIRRHKRLADYVEQKNTAAVK